MHKYAYTKQFSKPNFIKDLKEDKYYILCAPNRISGDIDCWVLSGELINRFYMGEPLPLKGFYYDSKPYNSYEEAKKVALNSGYEFGE